MLLLIRTPACRLECARQSPISKNKRPLRGGLPTRRTPLVNLARQGRRTPDPPGPRTRRANPALARHHRRRRLVEPPIQPGNRPRRSRSGTRRPPPPFRRLNKMARHPRQQSRSRRPHAPRCPRPRLHPRPNRIRRRHPLGHHPHRQRQQTQPHLAPRRHPRRLATNDLDPVVRQVAGDLFSASAARSFRPLSAFRGWHSTSYRRATSWLRDTK